MIRVTIMVLGYICLAIGFVGILTPIPLGLVFFVLALLMLIPTSPLVVRLIQKVRKKSPRFDRMLEGIARRLPSPYRRILKTTDLEMMDRHFH